MGITGIGNVTMRNLMGATITGSRALWLRYVGITTVTGGMQQILLCDTTIGAATSAFATNVKCAITCPSGPTGYTVTQEFVEPGLKFTSGCAVTLISGGTATIASYIFGCGYEE